MLTTIAAFIRDEEGATAVEYGLMAALIAAVIIAAVTSIGSNLKDVFDNVASKLTVAS
ncbi:Flp family type IVb pilin [Desulfovibrio aerotolerans]|uniref:Flp family type IVb pilin n=1 Tax=Solidesulfovibrio aerotolerans TaxID=295255 RepID=A0A7C9J7W5_9BACT|nr:Flp family type IVb pilin [Solidesulfovibrio aerotolerans]MYL82438.1 Flp family type IVb pilin [Solidesulfovibrio aerotolerans]